MSRSTFLGNVAVYSTAKNAVSALHRTMTGKCRNRRLLSFAGKEKKYNLVVSCAKNVKPFNPYSGKMNMRETGVTGVSVSSIVTPVKAMKNFNASIMYCGSCHNFQASDNKHLTKKCIICAVDTVEPEEDVENIEITTEDQKMPMEETYSDMEKPKGPSKEYKQSLADMEEEEEEDYVDEEDIYTDETDMEEEEDYVDEEDTYTDETDMEEDEADDVIIHAEDDDDVEAVAEMLSTVSDSIVNCSRIGNTYKVRIKKSASKVLAATAMSRASFGTSVSSFKYNVSSLADRKALQRAIAKNKSNIKRVVSIGNRYELLACDSTVKELKEQFSGQDSYEDIPVDMVELEKDYTYSDMDEFVDELPSEEELEAEVMPSDMYGATEDDRMMTDNNRMMTDDQLIEVDMLEEGLDRDLTIVSSSVDLMFKAGSAVNGSKWFALVDEKPIAYATHTSVGNNSDIFHDHEKFKVAVSAVLTQSGVYGGLKEMGFSGVKINMPIARLVDNKIAKAKRIAMISASNQLATFKEGITKALSTAAVGLNKGFFADTRSPVKSALYTSLSGSGIQNAEQIIDDAFSKSGDDYHKVLMKKASELLDMTESAFNEVSTAVANATYQRASTPTLSARVSAHLTGSNAIRTVIPQTQQVSQSSASDAELASRMKQMISGYGK